VGDQLPTQAARLVAEERVEDEIVRFAVPRGEGESPEHVGRAAAQQRILQRQARADALALEPERPQLIARTGAGIAYERAHQQARAIERLVVSGREIAELAALIGRRDAGDRDSLACAQRVVEG